MPEKKCSCSHPRPLGPDRSTFPFFSIRSRLTCMVQLVAGRTDAFFMADQLIDK
jgi:hypothetical protein